MRLFLFFLFAVDAAVPDGLRDCSCQQNGETLCVADGGCTSTALEARQQCYKCSPCSQPYVGPPPQLISFAEGYFLRGLLLQLQPPTTSIISSSFTHCGVAEQVAAALRVDAAGAWQVSVGPIAWTGKQYLLSEALPPATYATAVQHCRLLGGRVATLADFRTYEPSSSEPICPDCWTSDWTTQSRVEDGDCLTVSASMAGTQVTPCWERRRSRCYRVNRDDFAVTLQVLLWAPDSLRAVIPPFVASDEVGFKDGVLGGQKLNALLQDESLVGSTLISSPLTVFQNPQRYHTCRLKMQVVSGAAPSVIESHLRDKLGPLDPETTFLSVLGGINTFEAVIVMAGNNTVCSSDRNLEADVREALGDMLVQLSVVEVAQTVDTDSLPTTAPRRLRIPPVLDDPPTALPFFLLVSSAALATLLLTIYTCSTWITMPSLPDLTDEERPIPNCSPSISDGQVAESGSGSGCDRGKVVVEKDNVTEPPMVQSLVASPRLVQSLVASPMSSGFIPPMVESLTSPTGSDLNLPAVHSSASPASGFVPPMVESLTSPTGSGINPPVVHSSASGFIPPMVESLTSPTGSDINPPVVHSSASPASGFVPPMVESLTSPTMAESIVQSVRSRGGPPLVDSVVQPVSLMQPELVQSGVWEPVHEGGTALDQQRMERERLLLAEMARRGINPLLAGGVGRAFDPEPPFSKADSCTTQGLSNTVSSG